MEGWAKLTAVHCNWTKLSDWFHNIFKEGHYMTKFSKYLDVHSLTYNYRYWSLMDDKWPTVVHYNWIVGLEFTTFSRKVVKRKQTYDLCFVKKLKHQILYFSICFWTDGKISVRINFNLPLFSTVFPSNSSCFCPVGLSLL